MKRTALVAALAIAALLGVSLTLIYLVTSPASPHPEPPPPVAMLAAEPMVPPPPIVLAPAPRTATVAAPSAPAGFRRDGGTVAAMWKSSAQDRSPVPMADRVTRKAIRTALLAAPVQSRLARCVDRDVGFGAAPGIVPRDRPATLVLELEARRGGVRIVDVQVERWGGANEQTISCAREALLGTAIAASTAAPAPRVRMPFPLSPKRTALAATR
jgi:hypothetical protein